MIMGIISLIIFIVGIFLFFELRPSETELLLDYITNLQEENETLETIKDYHINIIDSMEDYKSRVNKAIEYIKKAQYVEDNMEGEDFYKNYEYSKGDLLNILEGDDKDEIGEQDKEIERLNKEKVDLFNKSVELNMQIRELKEKEITIMKQYFQMIIDLGYDYDGFNNVKDLKGLIDALCKYASLGKECNTTEPIYANSNKKYNILCEELKEGK